MTRDWSSTHPHWWKIHGAAVLALGLTVFLCSPSWAVAPTEQKPDGQALYEQHCAKCHAGQSTRAAQLDILRRLPAEFVLHSLELGKMKFQGVLRTNEERRAISEWVTAKKLKPEAATDETVAGFCADAPGEFVVADDAPQWNGWGVDGVNSRFQPADQAGVSAAQVPRLKVKWVFGLPMDYQTSQPTVVGNRVFVGTMKGRVYALDAKTGCLYWSMKPRARCVVNPGRRETARNRAGPPCRLFRRLRSHGVCP